MKTIKIFFAISLLGNILNAQSITLTPNGNQNEITVKSLIGSPIFWGLKAGGSPSSRTAAPALSNLMLLGGNGGTSTGFDATISAQIELKSSQAFTSVGSGSDIILTTTTNGTDTPEERMWIRENGNIGIGDNNPSTLLHVSNGSIITTPAPNTLLTVESNTYTALSLIAGTETGLMFGNSTSNARGKITYNPVTDNMSFFTANANRMTIDGLKVGIGTTTPNTTLDVNGDLRLSKRKDVEHFGTGCATCPMVILNLNRENASVIRFFGGNIIQLSGIQGGVDGMIVYLYALSSTTLQLVNDSGGSTGNRILTGTGANLGIATGGGITLVYDSDNDGYWRVIGYTQ